MIKNNVKALTAEGGKPFDEALTNLEVVITAEVPITQADKTGARASEAEMSRLDFIIDNVAKIDEDLPKNFDSNVFANTKAFLKEKYRQVAELERIVMNIKSQIAVARIDLKPHFRTFYVGSDKAQKRDITLRYIYVNMQECYARTKSIESDKNDPDNTGKTGDTPK